MNEFTNDPFARMAEVPRFTLNSTDISDGAEVPTAQRSGMMGIPGGEDVSPHLSWSNFPDETKAFAVTCYDVDAPTGSGFWHWSVVNIPASVTELPTDAGNPDKQALPKEAITLKNDAGQARYIGAAPPEGHGVHRYFYIVYALSEPLDIDESATPAFAGFTMFFSCIGRAWMETTFENT